MTDVLSRVEQGPVGVTLGHRLDQLIFSVDPSRTTFTATELDELTQLIYALIAEWQVVVGEEKSAPDCCSTSVGPTAQLTGTP